MSLYTLVAHPNGQPDIRVALSPLFEALSVNCYTWQRGGSRVDVSPKSQPTRERMEQIAGDLRSAFPACKVRRYSGKVSIWAPTSMMDALIDLEELWQTWSAEGASHEAIRNAMINQPAFRAEVTL